jgi:hypothetical protein
VLFLAPDNVLWLMWTAQISGNQDTAIVRYRQSTDLGVSWGEIATLLDKPGTFIRQPITVLETATGCCRSSIAAPNRARNGWVMMISAR